MQWPDGGLGPSVAFGVTFDVPVLSGQCPSGPAGGASDGYGLGRGAAAGERLPRPGCSESLHDGAIHMPGHAPPQYR